MNTKDLAGVVAEQARLTKKNAEVAINATFVAIGEALVAGEEVRIPGFGTFVVKERAARTGLNPSTREKSKLRNLKQSVLKHLRILKIHLTNLV